jgi:hypothetical protein
MATKNKMKTSKSGKTPCTGSQNRTDNGKRMTELEGTAQMLATKVRKGLVGSTLPAIAIEVWFGPGQSVVNPDNKAQGMQRVRVDFGFQTDIKTGEPVWRIIIPEGYQGSPDDVLSQLALGVAVIAANVHKQYTEKDLAKLRTKGFKFETYGVKQGLIRSALALMGFKPNLVWTGAKKGCMTAKAISSKAVSYLASARKRLVERTKSGSICDVTFTKTVKASEASDDDTSTEPGSVLTLDFGTAEALAAARDIFGAKSNAALGRAIMGEIQARIDTAKEEARTLRAVNS